MLLAYVCWLISLAVFAVDSEPQPCCAPIDFPLAPVIDVHGPVSGHKTKLSDSFTICETKRKLKETSSLFTFNEDICNCIEHKCNFEVLSTVVNATKYLLMFEIFEGFHGKFELHQGTGIMIEPYLMITARHNVERMDVIYICDYPSSENCVEINVFGAAEITYFGDIAAIRFAESSEPSQQFIPLSGNSGKCNVGDDLMVIGFGSLMLNKNEDIITLDNCANCDYNYCIFDGLNMVPVYDIHFNGNNVSVSHEPMIAFGKILSHSSGIDYVLNWWHRHHSLDDVLKYNDIFIRYNSLQFIHSAPVISGMAGAALFHVDKNSDVVICGLQSYVETNITVIQETRYRTSVSPNVGSTIVFPI